MTARTRAAPDSTAHRPHSGRTPPRHPHARPSRDCQPSRPLKPRPYQGGRLRSVSNVPDLTPSKSKGAEVRNNDSAPPPESQSQNQKSKSKPQGEPGTPLTPSPGSRFPCTPPASPQQPRYRTATVTEEKHGRRHRLFMTTPAGTIMKCAHFARRCGIYAAASRRKIAAGRCAVSGQAASALLQSLGEPLPGVRSERDDGGGLRPPGILGIPDHDAARVIACLDATPAVRSAVTGLAPTRIAHAFHLSPASARHADR
jgi:hypothetical protein